MTTSMKAMTKPVRNVILWGLFAMTSALVIAVNTPVLWALSTCVLGLGLFLMWTEWYDNDVLNEIVAVILAPAALYCALNAVDRNGFAFISWGSDFSQIAGSIDGPGKVVASFRNGDIVRVTGSGEGVYQVDRILNVPASTEASSVDPGFAFQTTTKDGIRLAYAHRID